MSISLGSYEHLVAIIIIYILFIKCSGKKSVPFKNTYRYKSIIRHVNSINHFSIVVRLK